MRDAMFRRRVVIGSLCVITDETVIFHVAIEKYHIHLMFDLEDSKFEDVREGTVLFDVVMRRTDDDYYYVHSCVVKRHICDIELVKLNLN